MSLAIADGHTVSIHYSLFLEDGTIVDESSRGGPFIYVQGDQALPPGLQRALAGLRPGDEREVSLAPVDGYGLVDPRLERTVHRSMFPAGIELEPEMSFGAEGEGGVTQVWIKAVSGDDVVVTQNHPLAGEALRYRVRVVDVLEASAEGAEPPST